MEKIKIKDCKKIAKENLSRQSADLMLLGFTATILMSFLGIITIAMSSLVIFGAVDYGMTKVFYRNSLGETIKPQDALDGFKDKFGESFLAGFITQIIQKIPEALRILNVIAMLYSILALLGIGGFAQSEKYTDFGQGIQVITAMISLLAYFLLIQYAMAQYILVREENTTALQALKKSRLAMAGYVWKYILFKFSFILWGLLSLITFGLSNVYSRAYFLASEIAFFNHVYETYEKSTDGDSNNEAENTVNNNVIETEPQSEAVI